MFSGLSSLRKEEKKEPTAQNKALQDYLRKYTSDDAAEGGENKKKRKKKPKPEQGGAVQIVDADLTGFEALKLAAERKKAPPGAHGSIGGRDDGESKERAIQGRGEHE